MTLCATFLVVALAVAATGQQPLRTTPAAGVAERCDALAKIADAGHSGARLFADVADDDARGPNWKEFKTAEALNATSTGNNLNEVATAWLEGGRVVFVRFWYSSPSGDWNDEVDYCFDSQGVLQLARAELRTFYGGIRKKRDLVRQANGRYIEVNIEFLGLTTGKPVKPPDEYFDRPIPVIKKVDDLPFHRLLV